MAQDNLDFYVWAQKEEGGAIVSDGNATTSQITEAASAAAPQQAVARTSNVVKALKVSAMAVN